MSAPFVHESSYVDAGAEIGADTKIWHFCHISSGARIGRGCSLGQNVFVAPRVEIGDNVKIQNSMVFTNVVNPRSHISRKHEYKTTRIRRGASIGANATIVCGHDVGEYAFVAAGAVITKNVPAHALMAGVPARRMGWMCRCGVRLTFHGGTAVCPSCGDRYVEIAPDSIARKEA
jgi:UDP-2-acetamido-3-amino-2,3-dideoxy-glucuronate N-acetyltransferase